METVPRVIKVNGYFDNRHRAFPLNPTYWTMADERVQDQMISLDLKSSIWERFYTVAPLIVVGTKEGDGYDLAPKHMAMPIGWDHYFGFVCTPRHSTYHNAKHYGAFTVSFPQPDQVLMASLAASPRCGRPGYKPALLSLETIGADTVDGVFLKNSYLFLECNMDRIIDGFGNNSLIIGEIVAAHVHPKAIRASASDDQQLIYEMPLLAFLPPDRFATINESLAFPFPSKFDK